jgi:integrase
MPRIAKELSALAVRNMKVPGTYPVGGVPGLHLQVLPTGKQTWLLRATVGSNAQGKQRRREIGLGGHPKVGLALAREKAREMRGKIAEGIDPVAARQASRAALLAGRGVEITFSTAAKNYIDDHSPSWRNDKHAQQWTNTLAKYAEPIIGKLSVRDIEVGHVLSILRPIWSTKTETAKRVQGRIENILDWAKAHRYRTGENPAAWKGHLDKLLAAPTKLRKKVHFSALPSNQLEAFLRRLRQQEGIGARALEFAILTATRSGEVRGAIWHEIDLDAKVWTIPAERMKAQREHRVPLSGPALALLKALPKTVGNDLLFPAPRGGKLSDMTLTAVLRRMQINVTVHGFRSTFRDWTSEQTNYPRDVAEMALAHAIGDKVEAAYRRGDLFDKRTALMDDWANFCTIAK